MSLVRNANMLDQSPHSPSRLTHVCGAQNNVLPIGSWSIFLFFKITLVRCVCRASISSEMSLFLRWHRFILHLSAQAHRRSSLP